MGFNATQEEQIAGFGGGAGAYSGFGGGGMFAMIILVVVILWVLFRDGGRRDGCSEGYIHNGGGSCGPCVRPSFLDESNWESEYHTAKELCHIDRDVLEQGCKDRDAIHYEGETTRKLIEANYVQELRDKLTEKNTEIATLKSEAFTEAKFNQLAGMIGKTDLMIERMDCQMLKRPPEWGQAVTPCAGSIVSGCGPRRGGCEGFDGGFAVA